MYQASMLLPAKIHLMLEFVNRLIDLLMVVKGFLQ